MIVQVPVGAVVKQLRGVRKSRSPGREGGREGEPRQRGRGREKALLKTKRFMNIRAARGEKAQAQVALKSS